MYARWSEPERKELDKHKPCSDSIFDNNVYEDDDDGDGDDGIVESEWVKPLESSNEMETCPK